MTLRTAWRILLRPFRGKSLRPLHARTIELFHKGERVAVHVRTRVTSVKLVEIRGRREVAIGQAARGGIWMGSAVSMAASSAMASTCM